MMPDHAYVKSIKVSNEDDLIHLMKDCWRLGFYVKVEQHLPVRPVYEHHLDTFTLHIYKEKD